MTTLEKTRIGTDLKTRFPVLTFFRVLIGSFDFFPVIIEVAVKHQHRVQYWYTETGF